MSTITDQTHEHLLKHHFDFESFTEKMISTHDNRFDKIFWAAVEEYSENTPQTIVDMGTGPGLLLRDLRKIYPKSKLIGVEAQPVMLEKADELLKNENLQNYKLINHDLSLPKIQGIEDSSVELCICSMLLHELQVPTVLIDEMKRILKPRGTIIIYDWHRHPLREYSPSIRPNSLEEFTHFSEHCRYSVEDYIYLFSTSGFNILDTMVRKRGKHLLMAVSK